MASVTPPDATELKQLAAAGHFRAIALWVNQPLVPYSIYAQVQAAAQPGCLRILVEFKRPPKPERLVRMICSRLWQLRSEVIEGVHIIARPVGQSKILWQRRIRLAQPPAAQSVRSASRSQALPPQLSSRPRTSRTARAHRAIRRSQAVIDQQFKLIRAAMLTSSAAAAFVLGCLTEVFLSSGGPVLPTFNPAGQPAAEQPLPTGTEIAYAQPQRPSSIAAALEPVAVMPHERVLDPSDPNVTLMFGGEVTLGSLNLLPPDTADRLLSNIPAYQQADVAMVNLGNSLATAGTSMQEGYYQRTRPEAIRALVNGGIDIVGLSGDRTMDFGEQGLIETLETLDQEGLYRVGAGRSEVEARRPEILDVKGQRIAYLSYHADPAVAAIADRAGSNATTKAAVVEDIAALRGKVDWIVVNYRWTGEVGVTPEPAQVDLSQSAIDAGADLVVGYHPYQMQGAEVYEGRPIVYALGDFIFQEAPLDDRDTAALRVSLKDRQMKVEFLPIAIRQAQPQAATGEQGEAILQQIRQASQPLAEPLHFPVVLDAQAKPGSAPVEQTQPLGGELEPSDGSIFEGGQDLSREEGWQPEREIPAQTPAQTPNQSFDESFDESFEQPAEETLTEPLETAPRTSPQDIAPQDIAPQDILEETFGEPEPDPWGEEFIDEENWEDSPNSPAPAPAEPAANRNENGNEAETPTAPPKNNWGPKPSQTAPAAEPFSPTAAPAEATPEAIGPYSEPLVGPLSFKPPEAGIEAVSKEDTHPKPLP